MRNTIAFLLLSSLFVFMLVPSFALAENPVALGTLLGNQAVGLFSTKEGINTRMFIPSMSDTSMTTLDGSKVFNARLMCAGTAKFMELFVQPSATGDLATVVVSQDTDLNGSMDYSYGVPFPVSGVCSNGIVSCNPGTWNNCKAYKWVSSKSAKVELAATTLTDLGGCYCINSSCGSNLVWNNLPIVLRSLGGGAVAAIQTGNSRMAVSDVKIDSTVARYYGQNTKNCSTVAADDSNPEQYYHLPGNIEPGVTATVAAQAADSSSLYSLMYSAYQNTPQGEARTCSMTRSAMIRWTPQWDCYVDEVLNDQCRDLANDPDCRLMNETADGVIIFRNFAGTGLTPASICRDLTTTLQASCSYVCPGTGGWQIPCLSNPVCTVGGRTAACSGGVCPLDAGVACSSAPTCITNGEARLCQVQIPIQEATGGWSNGINVVASGNVLRFYTDGAETGHVTFAPGTTLTAVVEGPNYLTGRAFGGGNVFGLDRGYYGAKVTFTITGTTVTGVSSDPEAGLHHGGVSTNGSSLWISGTGLNRPGGSHWGSGSVRFDFSPNHCPIPGGSECRGSPGYCDKPCNMGDVCRDWWRKERTYMCRAQGADFSTIQERARTIKQSASRTDSTLYYRDYIDGRHEDRTLNISGGTETTDECIKACKTKKAVRSTDTTIADNRVRYQTDPTSYEFYYKACANGVCPVEPGESIVKDCRCVNDFAEASVVMQTLRMGNQDIICSSGTPRALQ